ncbi:MAG: hypothetical protein IPP40_04965 [bacterium]|nr:hypothetical protein [bacterium]
MSLTGRISCDSGRTGDIGNYAKVQSDSTILVAGAGNDASSSISRCLLAVQRTTTPIERKSNRIQFVNAYGQQSSGNRDPDFDMGSITGYLVGIHCSL